MSTRRPSYRVRNLFVFQDLLYSDEEDSSLRFLLVKFDGEPYEKTGETSDSSPPDIASGSIVARIDYSLEGSLVTVLQWESVWRDDWPLRLASQHLSRCLYQESKGYVLRVEDEAHSFWVSEGFSPVTNNPSNYLIR